MARTMTVGRMRCRPPPDLGLPQGFYRAEWEDVDSGPKHNVGRAVHEGRASGPGYPAKPRAEEAGLGGVQEYRTQLNEKGSKEFVDLIRDARSLIDTKATEDAVPIDRRGRGAGHERGGLPAAARAGTSRS